jgi:hypothetical protein
MQRVLVFIPGQISVEIFMLTSAKDKISKVEYTKLSSVC